MPRLAKISPNRMELLRNKRRLALAKRGHKLLKDKYDELIRRFVSYIKKSKSLRAASEENLKKLYKKYALFEAETPSINLTSLIERVPLAVDLNYETKNLLNSKVPVFNVETKRKNNYSVSFAPIAFEEYLKQFELTLEALVELTEHEHTVRTLAAEIERTRRRVNALEHVLIPSLSANIRFISMKLDELDRETRTRLMKTKEILTGAT